MPLSPDSKGDASSITVVRTVALKKVLLGKPEHVHIWFTRDFWCKATGVCYVASFRIAHNWAF